MLSTSSSISPSPPVVASIPSMRRRLLCRGMAGSGGEVIKYAANHETKPRNLTDHVFQNGWWNFHHRLRFACSMLGTRSKKYYPKWWFTMVETSDASWLKEHPYPFSTGSHGACYRKRFRVPCEGFLKISLSSLLQQKWRQGEFDFQFDLHIFLELGPWKQGQNTNISSYLFVVQKKYPWIWKAWQLRRDP